MELDTCQPDENTCTSERKARQLFRKIDFSMNEDISKEEIFHAMINDPAIVRFIKYNIGLSLTPCMTARS